MVERNFPQCSHPSPATLPTSPSSHAQTHTCTGSPLKISTHTSCCCWAGGSVSFGLMSFWLMLSASLLNVWLLLLHLSPLSTQSPHPSVLRPWPSGGHPPLTASSGCFLLLLWSPSQCTHTFVFGQL